MPAMTETNDLIRTVVDEIQTVAEGKPVVVAFSGGLDSSTENAARLYDGGGSGARCAEVGQAAGRGGVEAQAPAQAAGRTRVSWPGGRRGERSAPDPGQGGAISGGAGQREDHRAAVSQHRPGEPAAGASGGSLGPHHRGVAPALRHQ